MKTFTFYLSLLCALALHSGFAQAEPHESNERFGFNTRDMNPFTMIFNAPQISQSHTLIPQQWQWQLGSHISNTIYFENEGGEQLAIDAETNLTMLNIDYGLDNHWQLGIEIPFIQHGVGELDNFIDDFHNVLGLPEGFRPLFPTDQFRIKYDIDGNNVISLSDQVSGTGDISLRLIRDVAFIEQLDQISLGFSLSLPTGDSEKLLGSDTTDLSSWINFKDSFSNKWHHFGGVSVTLSSGDGVIADQHDQLILQFMYGINWRIHKRAALRLQGEFQNNSFSSDTRFLGHSSALISGGTLYFDHGYELELGVTEDIDVGTSSDAVLFINLTKTY